MSIRWSATLAVLVLIVISFHLSYYCTQNHSSYLLARRLSARALSETLQSTTIKPNLENQTKASPVSTEPLAFYSESSSTKREFDSLLIPPFIPFRSTFVISPKYSLAACRIQKNLSTILLNLFCYLNTPKKFLKRADDSLTTGFNTLISTKICNRTHASYIGNNSTFQTKLSIIRDPVERFLSAYVDKCIHEAKLHPERCYGCNRNMLCLLQKQYFRFLKIARGLVKEYSYEDRHFAPMSWFCDFDQETIKNYKFLYFGEAEEEQEQTVFELIDVFKNKGVDNETLDYFTETLTMNRTKHSTTGSSIREKVGIRMRTDPEVMEYLKLLYTNDYIIFNLESPFKTNSTFE